MKIIICYKRIRSILRCSDSQEITSALKLLIKPNLPSREFCFCQIQRNSTMELSMKLLKPFALRKIGVDFRNKQR